MTTPARAKGGRCQRRGQPLNIHSHRKCDCKVSIARRSIRNVIEREVKRGGSRRWTNGRKGKGGLIENDMPRDDDASAGEVKAPVPFMGGRVAKENTGCGSWC